MAQENKATDYFKRTIQSYLQRRAQEDELFAPRLANPQKNIDDCITFILNYVKESGCNGFADDEIYSLAWFSGSGCAPFIAGRCASAAGRTVLCLF